MCAWRRQSVLLTHATANLNDATHFAVLQGHQNKLDAISENYMQERLASCMKLLTDCGQKDGAKMPLAWPTPKISAFERSCRGKYESCKHDEITVDELCPKPKTATTSAANLCQQPVNAPKKAKESNAAPPAPGGFRTAREQLIINNKKQSAQAPPQPDACRLMNFSKKKPIEARGINSKFVSPLAETNEAADTTVNGNTKPPTVAIPPSLSHLDAAMVEQIMHESMHTYKPIAWEDIAGLEYAKSTFMETIILPLRRPDLFQNLRRPPRGVLLFGPPGTGKTLIAKCIATQAKATFFSINPSSLTSKWVGEGEKLVRTLFAVAVAHKPAIIFMDEVDSLLSQRNKNEHESSRRLKNEFFIQLDGTLTNDNDHIVVVGATNRPQELDEAMRRRFVRRLYVPLPALDARKQIIQKNIEQVKYELSEEQLMQLAELTEGYSGADMASLCSYAAMEPLRSLSVGEIDVIDAQQLAAVTMGDFESALKHVSKSVSASDVEQYVEWNKTYGSKSF
ncbi:CG3326 [Drosophila busckii]|uniref:CG3326 n=1 Tax=Drosophila busckii TaxID=30019 RepID=A0A0M5IWE8_DROBS|nr:CG3326 [Drosophila busckii]